MDELATCVRRALPLLRALRLRLLSRAHPRPEPRATHAGPLRSVPPRAGRLDALELTDQRGQRCVERLELGGLLGRSFGGLGLGFGSRRLASAATSSTGWFFDALVLQPPTSASSTAKLLGRLLAVQRRSVTRRSFGLPFGGGDLCRLGRRKGAPQQEQRQRRRGSPAGRAPCAAWQARRLRARRRRAALTARRALLSGRRNIRVLLAPAPEPLPRHSRPTGAH